MDINDNYVSTLPSAQNAIDLFAATWASHVPVEGLTTGVIPLFKDDRINWLIEHRGRFDGQSVLELGPLEGGHTYMLEQAGAASILAIEANTLAFMKCLITKEIMNTKNGRFALGDFDGYLAETSDRFDFLLASGVLYHMVDPMLTLTNMMRVTDEIFIWSHFFDDQAMPADDPRAASFTGETVVRELDGRKMTYRLRGYGDTPLARTFIGGLRPGSVWLDKGETIAFMESHGYAVTPSFEDNGHVHGPAACLYAKR